MKKRALTPAEQCLPVTWSACDRLTREASVGCLIARQPWHLIPLWHHVRGGSGLKPVLPSRAERLLRTTLHDETTSWQLAFMCYWTASVTSKIGSESERMLLLLSLCHLFSSVVSSTAADVGGQSRLWFPYKAGCWLNHANVSWSTHFWSSFRRLLSCWTLFVLQRTRALHRPTSFSRLSTHLDSRASSDSLNLS